MGLTTGSQNKGLHNDESDKINMQDMLELPLFNEETTSVQQNDTRFDEEIPRFPDPKGQGPLFYRCAHLCGLVFIA